MLGVAHLGAQNNTVFFPLKIKNDWCINLLLCLRHLLSLRPWTISEFFPLGYASLFKVALKTWMINTISSTNPTDGCVTCSEEGTLGHDPPPLQRGYWEDGAACGQPVCNQRQVPDSLCRSACVIYSVRHQSAELNATCFPIKSL